MAKDELDLPRIVKIAREFSRPYRIDRGAKFRLKDVDPDDTGDSNPRTSRAPRKRSPTGVEALAELQDMLYAQDRWAVLLIFQAMDAAGQGRRDQARDVGRQSAGLPGVLVQGADSRRSSTTTSCGAASSLPERGRIGIFNRSYYEEMLVVRVHPEYPRGAEAAAAARRQGHLEGALRGHQRLRALSVANGIVIRKFFLHVSQARAEEALPRAHRKAGEELEVLRQRRQGARLLGRLHGGLRGHDPRDRHAGGAVVRRAGGQQVVHAPRGRRRRHRRAGFARLHYPTIDATQRAELGAARKTLLAEKPAGAKSKGKKTRAKKR